MNLKLITKRVLILGAILVAYMTFFTAPTAILADEQATSTPVVVTAQVASSTAVVANVGEVVTNFLDSAPASTVDGITVFDENGQALQTNPDPTSYAFEGSANAASVGKSGEITQRREVFINNPQAGSTVYKGTNYNITWSFNYTPKKGHIVLRLTEPQGRRYGHVIMVIDKNVDVNARSYTWQVPDALPDAAYQISLVHVNDGNVVSGGFSGDFNIMAPVVNPELITVSAPATMTKGGSERIAWVDTYGKGPVAYSVQVKGASAPDATAGYVALSTSIGAQETLWSPAGLMHLTMGSSVWLTPGLYVFKVCRLNAASDPLSCSDWSAASNLVENQSYPIVVNSPASGATWEQGYSNMVTWSYSGHSSTTSYSVELVKGNATPQFLGNTYAPGFPEFRWTTGFVPQINPVNWNVVPGSDYRMKVCVLETTTCGFSSNFTLIAPQASTTITVQYPNGGESFSVGQNINVAWTDSAHTNLSQYAVFLVKNGVQYLVSTAVTDNGYLNFNWTIPSVVTDFASGATTSVDTGNLYRFKVCPSGVSRCDQSDSNFTITNGQPTTGWYGQYYDYRATDVGMNLPGNQWPDLIAFGPQDPQWNAYRYNYWYDSSRLVSSGYKTTLADGQFFPIDNLGADDPTGATTHNFHFGAHYMGVATVAQEGDYNYVLLSDDDSFVYVDGVLRENRSGLLNGPAARHDGTLHMVPGHNYRIDVYFAERHTGGSALYFYFATPGVVITPCFDGQCPVDPTNFPLVVSSPAAGADWQLHSNQNIAWNDAKPLASGETRQYDLYMVQNYQNMGLIASVNNTNSYNWSDVGRNVDGVYWPTGAYKVQVCTHPTATSPMRCGDSGEWNLTAEAVSLVVNAPTTGTTWMKDSSQVVTWTDSKPGAAARQYDVYVVKNYVNVGWIGSITGASQLTWQHAGQKVDSTYLPADTYEIQVCTHPNGTDTMRCANSGVWNLQDPAGQKYIYITSPTVGQTLYKGNATNITWTLNYMPTNGYQVVKLVNNANSAETVLAANLGYTARMLSATIPSSLTNGDYSLVVEHRDPANALVARGTASPYHVTSIPNNSGYAWCSAYYDLPETHRDIYPNNASHFPDHEVNGPLGSGWTRDWYSSDNYRFSDYENNLVFNSRFFPFDYLGESPVGTRHNYFFGAHFTSQATVAAEGNYNFTLKTDDDSWVYVNGQLVDDNGGMHTAATTTEGTIHMVPGQTYTIDVYYAERFAGDAYMNFHFVTPAVTLNAPVNCGNAANYPVVTRPNGGETWTRNSSEHITWDAPTSMTNADITLVAYDTPCGSNCPAVPTYTIATNVPTGHNGDYSWMVGAAVSGSVPDGNYRARVCQTGSNTICDESNDFFTIVTGGSTDNPPTAPLITYSTHATGTATTTENNNIQWTISTDDRGLLGYSFIWDHSSTTNPDNTVESTATGTDTVLTPGTWWFHIVAVDTAGQKSSPTTHYGPVVINEADNHNLVRVISPNGGEIWQMGSTHPITWYATSTIDTVDIDLVDYRDCSVAPCLAVLPHIRHIATSTTNDGVYSWMIPTDLSTTTQYVIRITGSYKGENISDESDGPFMVTAASSTDESLEIYDLSVDNITAHTATVHWKTRSNDGTPHPATSRVIYDLISHGSIAGCSAPNYCYAYSTDTFDETTKVITHTVQLTNLSANTSYYFRAVSHGSPEVVSAELNLGSNSDGNEGNFHTPSDDDRRGGGYVPVGQVLGTSTVATSSPCEVYLKKYIKYGAKNDPVEVRKLQAFLRIFEKRTDIKVTGVYDYKTFMAVKSFQKKYLKGVLTPWGITEPTGYVFITTTLKINSLYCGFSTDTKLNLRNFYKTYENKYVAPAVTGEVKGEAVKIDITPATSTEEATVTKNLSKNLTAGGFGGFSSCISCSWFPWLLVVLLIIYIIWDRGRREDAKNSSVTTSVPEKK